MKKIIKTLDAWAIVENTHNFPIPAIVHKMEDGNYIFPSTVFANKKKAEIAKENLDAIFPHKTEIIKVKITQKI